MLHLKFLDNFMNYKLFGINFKIADLNIRSKYSYTKKRISEFLIELSKYFSELVIISTCNRTELYLLSKINNLEILKIIKEKLNIQDNDIKYFYFIEGIDVIIHLFRLASGIESQIVGENEILHQVKESYLLSKELGLTGNNFNRLFQKAIEVGKLVRTKTDISKGNISIASVVFNMIGDYFNKKILIIGTGKVSELLVNYLKGKEVDVTVISNKNYEKALELAKIVNGKAGNFDILKEKLRESDFVISATSSPHYILKENDIVEIMKNREKELVIFDLACPCDVEPSIKKLKNVCLFNLDDIHIIMDSNYKKRLLEIPKVEKIIYEEIEKLCKVKELKRLELEPAQAI